MKKFLVILAVMAISPLASAAVGPLTLELDLPQDAAGNYIAAPDQIVTVTVVQGVANILGSGGKMTIDFTGPVVGVVNTTPGFLSAGTWNWTLDGGIEATATGVTFAKAAALGFGTYGPGSKNLAQELYVSTVQFSFKYTADTDLVWGGTWDGIDMTGVIGATVVPEPITLGLLSLGGLFIRRRK